MTSHPPSGPPSVPPAGPPSGPLSGPSTRPGNAGPPPPPGPPHGGSGGGGSSGGSGGGSSGGSGGGSGGDAGPGAPGNGGPDKGPWWRSVPKVASVTAILVAIAALAVVLTNRPDDKGDTAGSGGGEVFLQNAAASGPDPFTRSTARTGTASASPASLPPRTASATPEVSGSTPGLYGGTQSVASCDVEQQVRYLSGEPEKNTAFASVLGLSASEVPGYLRSLTPLQLRADTRVTNHGFRNGSATTYQAVLQAGTAVLVDGRGVPRVRCACGNPLTEPVAQKSPRTTGTPWQGYSNDQVVVVAPSVTVVNVFVVYDPENDSWFARQHGDHGKNDKPTPPPPPPTRSPSKSPSTSTSTSPSSPVPCVTVTGTETPTPSNGVTPSPCPSTLSPAPSTSSPSTPPSVTTPSTDTSPPPESPDSSPPTQSPGPESAPVTDGSADPNTGQSASGSSPAGSTSNSGSTSVPAPGQEAAHWSASVGSARQPLV
ncbi:DUF6777 domain-containing protein [Streptomyces zaomyceticus]|uniref:DUF6777 domain-containing protein n=1 Tax=Streptomyces zaomyceticus TaxID=68286 RepID=UPI003719EFEA